MPRKKTTRPSTKVAGSKVYVPSKHLEFARSVLADEKANQARTDAFALDAAEAARAGLDVDPRAAMNSAAFEQARAELE